jgi:hypothetical protein
MCDDLGLIMMSLEEYWSALQNFLEALVSNFRYSPCTFKYYVHGLPLLASNFRFVPSLKASKF